MVRVSGQRAERNEGRCAFLGTVRERNEALRLMTSELKRLASGMTGGVGQGQSRANMTPRRCGVLLCENGPRAQNVL